MKPQLSAILLNAVDSIERGIEFFATGEPDPPQKHAIRSLFHGLELLLKERLRKDHKLLIYRDLNRPLGPGSQTVGANEALQRLANLKVAISDEERTLVLKLQDERNRIEHHSYERSDELHVPLILGTLSFIERFCVDELGRSLGELLDDDSHLFRLQNRIGEYERDAARQK